MMAFRDNHFFFYLALLIVNLIFCHAAEVLQVLEDTVSGENFSYYRLSVQGRIYIELETLEGDADIYVSDETLQPDYMNYKLKSVTCGLDSVEVPAEFKRPVGIGIFGQPIHATSRYRITTKWLASTDENEDYQRLMDTYYKYEEYIFYDIEKLGNSEQVTTPAPDTDTLNEEGSLIWQIFVFFLKIIFEIIV
ncbi:hypothetical protein CHS0354_025853 [Potamilus streckersoni]|uniref:Uncharacterized protein n=1 Tax=Potamilus streckersoni TaxID=2493646 RepID=A0AAE0VTS3_9BIVA|nr:hypothetical protein CHS0354_025853 [Potamilus streckersoni]